METVFDAEKQYWRYVYTFDFLQQAKPLEASSLRGFAIVPVNRKPLPFTSFKSAHEAAPRSSRMFAPHTLDREQRQGLSRCQIEGKMCTYIIHTNNMCILIYIYTHIISKKYHTYIYILYIKLNYFMLYYIICYIILYHMILNYIILYHMISYQIIYHVLCTIYYI